MFSIFNRNSKEQQLRRDIFAFWVEMDKNMELFYVADQRQFISDVFLIDLWPRVRDLDMIKRQEAILIYAKAIEDFNHAFKVYKGYEAFYSGDMKNRNPENARKLHALKHELDQKLWGMEALIIPAGQDLEREMLQLGLLKA